MNPDIDGHEFHLKHISRGPFRKDQQLGIEEISRVFKSVLKKEDFDKASYIKPCVVATIYPVSHPQADVLTKLLLSKQPSNQDLKKWQRLIRARQSSMLPSAPYGAS